ncbi:HugZ family protein [Jannaschia sp. M317]|uniref:HugZ family pyridoxamine 5'-phosphate oxidase n=1 Tax=Jannaschia sp. M317 TaxID=2867011 RepID=UPI0021A38762|nr:pyridoxamine 5'-phosphate oxidase family protein [Jannaschia sp. M317]UWQ18696.1 pyridoxamine 5'-phosphate oxidase family protein [Jannaschia sp. M317]
MDPYRPLDDDARALTRDVLAGATTAALGTLRDGAPMVTRAGCLWLPGQGLFMLLSDLSDHARALAVDPACSLLLGEAGARGDPLTHPRLTLMGRVEPADKPALRAAYLARRPKATVYYDFTDFRLLRLALGEALLNGGFGKAYRLTRADLDALA